MTISYYNGAMYWMRSKMALEQVYKHLDRYCHKKQMLSESKKNRVRKCDILIYKYEVEYVSKPTREPDIGEAKYGMKKANEPQYWNRIGDLKFVEMYECYNPAIDTKVSLMVPSHENVSHEIVSNKIVSHENNSPR